jgi:hypothetical protein
MGLWPSRAARALDAVQNPPAQVIASETFPGSSNVYQITTGMPVEVAGVFEAPVERNLALSVPGIHRGITLKSTTIAGLPLERFDAGDKRVALGWLEQPEPDRPRFATLTDTIDDLQLDGLAYWLIRRRDANNAPAFGGVEYLKLTRVGDITLSGGVRTITVDGRPVDPRDVIGFSGWHDGIRRRGARLIRTALALEAASRRYADTPLAAVTLVNKSGVPLNEEEIDELLVGYKKSRNQDGVGYANAEVDVVPTGFDSSQLQLVEARQFINTQLANLLELPAQYIAGASAGSGGDIRYQNITQDARSLIDYGLKAPMMALESRLSMSDVAGNAWTNQVTPRGSTVRFSIDGLLRGNPLERAQLYQALIPIGVLTVEEARALEDLAPTPQGARP